MIDKEEEKGNDTNDKKHRQPIDIDQIIIDAHVDPDTFHHYLYQNVPAFMDTIESMSDICSTFSDTDLIYAKWKVGELL
jgi:hypothetical protein